MIDIIIPGYNCRETLSDCLDHIKCQTCIDKIHVIFVDDCSSENYSDILAQYQKDIDLKYIRSETNLGPGACRQIGLDNSSSDFVMFVDADDYILGDDSLAQYLEAMDEGYDYVYGLVYNEFLDTCVISDGDVHAKMYRRSFLDKHNVKFSSDRYHEDNLFNSLVILNGARIKRLEMVTYCYFDSKNSLTYQGLGDFSTYLEAYIKFVGTVFKLHKEKGFDEAIFADFLTGKKKYLNCVYEKASDTRRQYIDQLLDRYEVIGLIH